MPTGKQKLKVIQFIPAMNSGGVEQGTLEIGKFLVDHGHESVVVSSGGRLVERLAREGSRHITLPVHKKSLSSLFQVSRVRQLIQDEQPDILHVRSRVPAWIVYLAWRGLDPAKRPALVSTVHGFYSVNAYSRVMTFGQRVIAVSNAARQYIADAWPKTDMNKVRVIPRGIDPDRIPPGHQPEASWLNRWKSDYPELEGKFVLLLPGRITRIKGHEDLVRIIAGLRDMGIPAHALCVGEPSPRKQAYFDELKQTISQAGQADAWTFTGHRSDLPDIMAVSDVVLSLTTVPESFGRTTLEALGMGRPVMGYDHGGVSEQLSLLFPEGKIPLGDTAEAIRKLAAWYPKPPAPAGGVPSPFRLSDMCQSTLDVYRELVP